MKYTAGDIKKALENIPDDTPVTVRYEGGYGFITSSQYGEVNYSSGPGMPVQSTRSEITLVVQ